MYAKNTQMPKFAREENVHAKRSDFLKSIIYMLLVEMLLI